MDKAYFNMILSVKFLSICAECYGIQHLKTGFSGERVER